ncbi:hypothetical protein D3C75_1088790 [compost metagenome]
MGHGDLRQREFGGRRRRPADPAGADAEQEGDRGRDGEGTPAGTCRRGRQGDDNIVIVGLHRLPEQDALDQPGRHLDLQGPLQLTIQLLHLVQVLAIGRGGLRRVEERRILIHWMGDSPAAKLKLIH